MPAEPDWISPKQAARALGVSESSLKRWCDRGLLKITRTAGGHRQLPVSEVVRFAREQQHPVVCAEVLGLPAVGPQSLLALDRAAPLLTQALLAGDERQSSRIVFDLYLARHRLSVIFDSVVTVAFQAIGEKWECHQAEVYEERQGCEIVRHLLSALRRLQTPPSGKWTAIGGTLEADPYQLPTTMVELVLRENGWKATSLGSGIPVSSWVEAADRIRPSLLWLSVSVVPDPAQFLEHFSRLSEACGRRQIALVVGGRGLVPELRQQMSYSTYCDTMNHLETFAQTLLLRA